MCTATIAASAVTAAIAAAAWPIDASAVTAAIAAAAWPIDAATVSAAAVSAAAAATVSAAAVSAAAAATVSAAAKPLATAAIPTAAVSIASSAYTAASFSAATAAAIPTAAASRAPHSAAVPSRLHHKDAPHRPGQSVQQHIHHSRRLGGEHLPRRSAVQPLRRELHANLRIAFVCRCRHGRMHAQVRVPF